MQAAAARSLSHDACACRQLQAQLAAQQQSSRCLQKGNAPEPVRAHSLPSVRGDAFPACSWPACSRAHPYVLLREGRAGVARAGAVVAQLGAVAAVPLQAQHAAHAEGVRCVGVHHRAPEPDGEAIDIGLPWADLLLPQAAARQHRLRLPCPPGCLRGCRPRALQVPAQAAAAPWGPALR